LERKRSLKQLSNSSGNWKGVAQGRLKPKNKFIHGKVAFNFRYLASKLSKAATIPLVPYSYATYKPTSKSIASIQRFQK
jgi:hypothetical protein